MGILRVNLSSASIQFDNSYPQCWGRELVAEVLTKEVDARCHPFSLKNKLIFARGPLAGTGVSSCGRLSVGGKSPLTGGIKESNAGGTAGSYLANWGIRGIIFEGGVSTPHILVIGNEIKLVKEPELFGLSTTETTQLCQEKYGKDCSIVCIGPAGDNKLSAAGVAVTDRDGRPGRYAGRGGLGGVMGSKGLKAIVIKKALKRKKTFYDEEAFKEARKKLHEAIRTHPVTGKEFPLFGTASIVNKVQGFGALPTFNFRKGQFEGAENLSGETLRDLILKRGGKGKTAHSCMAGCLVQCSNVFADEKGEIVVSPLEYETIGMMGSNLGISSLDDVAFFNSKCNELGLDTIETGAAIGVLMDEGFIPFGDTKGIIQILREIEEMSVLGRVVGNGAEITGKVFGSKRIPTAKGQAFPAYDPRGIKGLGVTFATSPMGADHTAGYTFPVNIDHHSSEGQLELSRQSQILRTPFDAWGICSFIQPALMGNLELLIQMINAVQGTNYTVDTLRSIGEKIIKLERQFNKAAGVKENDAIPEFLRCEPLPPYNLIFDVDREGINKLFEDL